MLQVLWDLGYPCLVSAFCLLQLAVVRAEGAEKGAQRVTRLTESTASIVITFHFCLIITSGVLGAVQNWLRVSRYVDSYIHYMAKNHRTLSRLDEYIIKFWMDFFFQLQE